MASFDIELYNFESLPLQCQAVHFRRRRGFTRLAGRSAGLSFTEQLTLVLLQLGDSCGQRSPLTFDYSESFLQVARFGSLLLPAGIEVGQTLTKFADSDDGLAQAAAALAICQVEPTPQGVDALPICRQRAAGFVLDYLPENFQLHAAERKPITYL